MLIGGSGAYSATGEGKWLDRTLDLLRDLVEASQPTFASCWGFQAMARALGGHVVTDLQRAEYVEKMAGMTLDVFGLAAKKRRKHAPCYNDS